MSKPYYDAIILLGGSINLDGSLFDRDKIRLKKVAELYKENAVKAIIACGLYGYKSAEKPIMSEAQAYANYLEELGVPSDAMYLEAKSQETLGNILFAKIHILAKHQWHHLLVMPTYDHSMARIEYLLAKILGDAYAWDILQIEQNRNAKNLEREATSLKHTKDINDRFADGDHDAIYRGLMATHPAYRGESENKS